MIYLRAHHLGLLQGYMQYYNNKYKDWLENKKNRIIKTAMHNKHSKKHGLNIIQILEKIINSNEKVKLIDSIDDICSTCNFKNKKSCIEFIPYGISASCEDRSYLHFYRLKKREYTFGFIEKRLKEREAF